MCVGWGNVFVCVIDCGLAGFVASNARRSFVHQVEELLARLRVVAEHAQHGGRNRFAVDLLHAAHHHAHVPGGGVM